MRSFHSLHMQSTVVRAGLLEQPLVQDEKEKSVDRPCAVRVLRGCSCCAILLVCLILFSLNQYLAQEDGLYEVRCKTVPVPGLTEFVPLFRAARICYPKANGTFPLHLFAHGDWGGGAFFWLGYAGLQEQLASYGFVVPAYLSCWFDAECSNGQASFLEALKTITFLERHPNVAPVDWTKPYSASGHSTGARAVLMLAALRDNPAFLDNTTFASEVTPDMRTALVKLKGVIADHPDPMYDEKQNPDIPNFRITETPVFVITGSGDWIEPNGSAWRDFQMISSRDKVFINVHGAGHMEPNLYHSEGPFVAFFARAFALGDVSARAKIYGEGADSLQRTLELAHAGDYNSGADKVAFLACSRDKTAVPHGFASYCDQGNDDELIWSTSEEVIILK
mmetsp:Transcript_19125/g.49433  ORF Transcript_19125/g.49433 Transcript_19125/m.49433 type:complete len:393 (-) Transcript_19125:210-1388(-)